MERCFKIKKPITLIHSTDIRLKKKIDLIISVGVEKVFCHTQKLHDKNSRQNRNRELP